MELRLSVPDMIFFPSYLKALDENFAYGSGLPYPAEKIATIKDNPQQHLTDLNPPFKDGVFIAKDGSTWPRVPQETIWITSGNDFIGAISFRPTIHSTLERMGGHVGYSTTPSARGKGYMIKALKLLLDDTKRVAQIDRDYAVLTTDPDNYASQKIILENGGEFIEEYFFAPMEMPLRLYHIPLKVAA